MMYLRPEQPFSRGSIIPPVWNRTDHDDWEGRNGASGESAYRPGGCLVTENNKGLQLFFYVPDVKNDHLNLEVIDDVIHLTCQREGKKIFARSLSIDTEKFDVSRLDASLEDGVLQISAPKRRIRRNKMFRRRLRNSRQGGVQDIEVALVEPHEINKSERERFVDEVFNPDSRDDTSATDDDRIIGMTVAF